MNCTMFFLKRARLRTPYTFVKIIPLDYSWREERVLKKCISDSEAKNVAEIISCPVCCPGGGDFIKEILRGLIFSYLKK